MYVHYILYTCFQVEEIKRKFSGRELSDRKCYLIGNIKRIRVRFFKDTIYYSFLVYNEKLLKNENISEDIL